ncbi:FEN1-like nuclease [Hypsugopox virus]|nr:FEN1-like nuclease [Hypsugopox virus]
MGIKNLKSLLLKCECLKEIEAVQHSYNGVFVDTMSFYVSIAYCANNVNDLTNLFLKYVNIWIKQGGNVYLFIDKGEIYIKEQLRLKRRNAANKTIDKKQQEINTLTNEIDNLENSNTFYEEIKTESELKIKQLSFQVFLANTNNLKQTLEIALQQLSKNENVKIIYCNGIDAEFKMCAEAKKRVLQTGVWPLLVSNDQDTLLFSSCDDMPKIIKNVSHVFRYMPCSMTLYLAKLTALVNGCDFFPGLYGACLTPKILEKMKLFYDFTIDNIVKSLVVKNYINKTFTIVDVNSIVNFINSYTSTDENIYLHTPPNGCTVQEFIFSCLYTQWNKFNKNYFKNTTIENNLIYNLIPQKDILHNEINTLNQIIHIKSNKIDLHNLKTIANIFGYKINNNVYKTYYGVYKTYYGIYKLKELLLCYDDYFYFNDKIIIENKLKCNIINIGK